MHQGFKNAVDDYLEAENLDALVASSPINFTYASGCAISTQKTIPSRTAYVIYSRDAPPVVVACATEESYVRKVSKIHEIRTYVEHYQDPVNLVAETLGAARRVGIEEEYFTLSHFGRLKKALPLASFVPSDSFFAECRMVKRKDEVEILGLAAKNTCSVIESTFSRIHEGMTELDVAEQLAGGIMRAGADGVAFMALSSGQNRFIMHHYPENKIIRKGELVHTDFGGEWKGYYSDLVRMACLGEPSQDEKFKARAVFRAHRAILERMKPGVEASELYTACKKSLQREGLKFDIPHIGHSLGLELHEEPVISPFSKELLKEDMVFCIEPGLVGPGDFYHIEDTVVLEKDGVRFLSREIGEDEFPMVLNT